jgi:hypothetical protein
MADYGMDLRQGEKRIQWNGNASGSNDRHEPAKATRIVGLVYRDAFASPHAGLFQQKTGHDINLAVKIVESLYFLGRPIQGGKAFVVADNAVAPQRQQLIEK